MDQLSPGIRVGGLRRGLWVSTYITDYGQSLQELMDPASRLHQFKPSTVLVLFDALSLFGTQPLSPHGEAASRQLERALGQVQIYGGFPGKNSAVSGSSTRRPFPFTSP